MIELSSRLRIKEGNQSSIIFKKSECTGIISFSRKQLFCGPNYAHISGKFSEKWKIPTAQLASHQAELRGEEKYPDQKCLNISSLQTEQLKLDSSQSGSSKHNEKENSAQAKCTYCGLSNHSLGKCFKRIRKEKQKARYAGTSSNKNPDLPARKFFRCGSEDHLISKCPKTPKDSEKRRKSDKAKEKGNSAKENSGDDGEIKVYAYMAQMSNNNVMENKDYGDSS